VCHTFADEWQFLYVVNFIKVSVEVTFVFIIMSGYICECLMQHVMNEIFVLCIVIRQ